ncbi:MAG: cation:proton antiporter [Candidatus Nanopelagicales bacterium]|jgi:monovalent cation:H+ antiporter-2, CPA2 family|nr:cation:proton antiporter [Candidatus Nanopelagicales bacterium]MDP4906634.1 cation:proton antiporter [Candidatus Nanopelagicales bacterium]MDP4974944.1 cation:proton antiporter [Candidatus Nanopelagicales bacterium]MDP5095074.1 cation:proton antiporter [Candidatus Nanopelagicales bacterium]
MPTAEGTTAYASIFLEFGLLLVGLGILARIAHALSISPVPLYLIAGLFFGEGGIVGIPASDLFVATIAELGVVLLLLLLGLEYSGQELVETARRQSSTGLVDLVLNSLPGVALALILGWGWIGALALGGVTYISSSGIISQVVRDLRWRRNPETAPVVSVLVLEDLVMAPYLPILTVLLTGTGLVTGLISVLTALVVVGVVLVIAVKGSVRFHRMLSPRDPVGLLLLVFGAAIAAAGLAGLVDFSPAVAAFLVGLLLTGEVAEVARRRLDPLRDVLAAVFFAYFGLAVNPGDLPGVLIPAILLAIVTIGTKFITGWFAARTVKGTTMGALRAGALLSARGEFSVVIAGLVAVSLVLPPEFQALVAAYVLITASAGPILARFVEPFAWWWQQRPPRKRRRLDA